MTKAINEAVARLQKLSGIILEDNAFDNGRPNSGNHDDAHWDALAKSGREAAGPAGHLLHDSDGSVVDLDNSLLMWGDESQQSVIAVSGVTSMEQFDSQLRSLVGDAVYSAYIDEPGTFDEIPANEVEQIGGDVFVEIMSVKEVARLLNRWAARNGMGQHLQRFDKTNMRAGA